MHGWNLTGIVGCKYRIDTGGDFGGGKQLDRLNSGIEDPCPADGVAGFPLGPVQTYLNCHQAVGSKTRDQFGSDQRAVGGDAGHDPPAVAGSQDLFEVGAEKRFAAAEVDLKDPRLVHLLHQVDQLGLQDKVEIRAIPMDNRQAMAEGLSRASLFVLLSEFETHPIAVLEAVSLGVPALVADTSGLRELSQEGLAQSIPLQSSPPAIAQAVAALLKAPPTPPTVPLPTWDDCARNLSVLYQEILNPPRGETYAHPHAHPVLSSHFGRD